MSNNNPLLSNFETPYGSVPFDKIETSHYKEAFDIAIAEAKEEIDKIINSDEKPTFENTIEAMEFSGRRLGIVSSIFFNLNNAHTNDLMQEIALEVSPKLTEFSNYISLNETLFAKVKEVYEECDTTSLTKEQKVLLKESYKSFARNGAELDGEKKSRYEEISKELSTLSLQFRQNVLAATNDFKMILTNEDELVGLPDFVLEMAALEAKNQDTTGYIFTLQAPSMIPFMQYSEREDLREKLWRASNSKCLKDSKFNNEDIVKQIVALRLERATLLGYANHAEFVLEERMAKNISTVEDFLAELLEKSLPYGKNDVSAIAKYAKDSGEKGELMPWDFSFYSDKLKEERYAINDELLKPYFELSRCREGIFTLCNKLYGITFEKNDQIPTYHKDVESYVVKESNGDIIGLIYLDFFPRDSKSGGAWMTSFQDQYIYEGENYLPHVSVVCNFTKPTETTPSLLTFDELTTFLHEFGHALHGLFADGTYPSVTGTNVAWDFVELPSQIMENWATEREFLSLFAKHYQTEEDIPDELITKIIAAKNYLNGYLSVRQLSFGITDMRWHTITSPVTMDVEKFEKEAIAKCSLLPSIAGTTLSPAFSHIFAGGYSAGYYSYKWAEVLEADAFSLFEENGVFNSEIAKSFRENILSKGSSEEAMTLYEKFRGRKPTTEALLKKLNE